MLRIILLLATIICGPVAIAENTTNCGSLYGDWNVDDYRDSKFWNQAPGERTHLYLVEAYHFNNAKEMMAKNQNLTSQQARVIWKDLDYTLRHIPNHHLALHYVFDLERRNGGVLMMAIQVEKLDLYPHLTVILIEQHGSIPKTMLST